MTNFHGDEANFFFFFEKKKNKKIRLKKKLLHQFSFHGLVLGLVELNDVKGIDVAQPIWP